MAWDPAQYLKFGGERLRPAHDLIARIPLDAPASIVDPVWGPTIVLVGVTHALAAGVAPRGAPLLLLLCAAGASAVNAAPTFATASLSPT